MKVRNAQRATKMVLWLGA
jgi:hypothetical protein